MKLFFFNKYEDDKEIFELIRKNDLNVISHLYQKYYPVILDLIKEETETKSLIQSALLILRNLIVQKKIKENVGIEKFLVNWCMNHWQENQKDIVLEAKIYDSLKANDGWAFYYINITYSPSVFHYVKLHGGNKEDAEDLVQDAILVLINNINLGKYEPRANTKIKTYFIGICKNLWLDRLKRMKRSVSYSSFEDFDWDNVQNFDFLDEIIDDQSLNDRQKIVIDLFDQATDACKKVLGYFYFRNLSHEEIAEELGYNNADTSKTQKNKCLKKLKLVVMKKLGDVDINELD